ncbi:MAG: transcription antitermination factor NusB [Verrucomicrobiae bacterium]|nr:transcription antitermination factor NusB [Verrucomicrobiae bacterium]
MRLRRVAREKALQFLFQHEVNPMEDLGRELDAFWEEQFAVMRSERGVERPVGEGEPPPGPTVEEAEIRVFADGLIRGTLTRREDIDRRLSEVMINWSLNRLASVDRSLLRMAVYELQYREDIPPVVTINEAIEIARKFSTADSGKFVNGILDRIKGELNRPAREPAGA